jgi:hypothetical protein
MGVLPGILCCFEGAMMMRDYRAYILRTDGHRFLRVAGFASDQPDDLTAMKAAERLVDGHDVELWDCARLVARIDHETGTVVVSDDGVLAGLKTVPDQSLAPTGDVKSTERA